MFKSGRSIRRLLSNAGPLSERLVISPILDLDNQVRPGTASVDLRLGSTFRVPKRPQLVSLDPVNRYEIDKHKYTEEIYVEIGKHFVLHPRHFALGITLEWIHLPNNLAAFITGKSTWGRDGLVIETAAGVHPGYSGNLTLELTNVGEVPLLLYPGLAYAQIFVFDVEQLKDVKGDVSSFLGTTAPKSGQSKKDLMFSVIEKLRSR